MKKYGILDADIKKTLVKNRDLGIDALGRKLTVADKVRILEDKLMSQKFTTQEAADIRAEIKYLKENYKV